MDGRKGIRTDKASAFTCHEFRKHCKNKFISVGYGILKFTLNFSQNPPDDKATEVQILKAHLIDVCGLPSKYSSVFLTVSLQKGFLVSRCHNPLPDVDATVNESSLGEDTGACRDHQDSIVKLINLHRKNKL